MSEELYLILHKVRGEPAFDIAHKIQIGDEEGWIIPTSGHRAYPFRKWPATSLVNTVTNLNLLDEEKRTNYNMDEWRSWPDHYSANATPKTSIRDIIRGLFPRQPSNFKKRTW